MINDKENKETFMHQMWKNYKNTNDIEYLAKACENAPFFGQSEMAKEIAKKLRELKNKLRGYNV